MLSAISVLVGKKAPWDISNLRPQSSSCRRSSPSAPVGPSVPPESPSIVVWRSTGGRGSPRAAGGGGAVRVRAPAPPRRVVGRDVPEPRPFAPPVARRVARFARQLAVVDVDDQVPAAACV